MASNPFTTVYDAILAELVRDKFPVNSIVNWNSSRDPEPEIPTDSELPELQFRPTGLTAQLGNVSCGTEVQRTYQILINSGDMRAGILFGVEWRLLATMFRLKYVTLEPLEYVSRIDISGSNSGLSNSEENRGIKGWTALWDITVVMQFNAIDLGT